MPRIDATRLRQIRAALHSETWTLGDLREQALDLLEAVDVLMAAEPRFWTAAKRERMARIDATARAVLAARPNHDPRGVYDTAAWLERERDAFIEREAEESAKGGDHG